MNERDEAVIEPVERKYPVSVYTVVGQSLVWPMTFLVATVIFCACGMQAVHWYVEHQVPLDKRDLVADCTIEQLEFARGLTDREIKIVKGLRKADRNLQSFVRSPSSSADRLARILSVKDPEEAARLHDSLTGSSE